MAAPEPAARRILIAWSTDWTDVARTLRWSLQHVLRGDDRVTLVHVRATDALLPAAVPLVEVAVPLHTLLAAWHAGDTGPSSKAVAAALEALRADAAQLDAVELRTTLRVSDALLTYLRYLPAHERASALVMGSHGARNVGAALWKVPHASLDVAAGNTLCPLFLARPRDEATLDVAGHPEWAPRLGGGGGGGGGQAQAVPPTGGTTSARSVVLALDGAAPSSSLMTRWCIENALKAGDEVTVVNRCGSEHDAACAPAPAPKRA